MLSTYAYPTFAYTRSAEMDRPADQPARLPLVIVGAGPVGLTAALDARRQGLAVTVLDDDHTVSVGSRGLCYAKRTLDVLDRLGVADAVVAKGVTWNVGRTFFGDREVFRFDLLPEADHHRPGMVNLQQYYLEQYLVEQCRREGVDLRWRHRVVAVDPRADGVGLRVATPDGEFALDCDWLVACDGARSPVRRMLGLEMSGRVFTDRFLIADVVMKAPFPAERWFWFDPPFHRRQSVLLHREADDVWRIDFQLGEDADPEEEKKPERVIPRIRAMLGEGCEFALEWVSVYTFQCRRMERFVHGRVLFAGDSAHQVSPFGARGANSGIQDADNLMWKLRLVMLGVAPVSLLDSYDLERGWAADENILNSTRSTDFITPKSGVSRSFRDAALELAGEIPFARRLVNSGRLSMPTVYDGSPLNTPDAATGTQAAADADPTSFTAPSTAPLFDGPMRPGASMEDAPVEMDGHRAWLLQQVGGAFRLVAFVDHPQSAAAQSVVEAWREVAQAVQAGSSVSVAPWLNERPLLVSSVPGSHDRAEVVHDMRGLAARRHGVGSQRQPSVSGVTPPAVLLVRPDQHVAARWVGVDAQAITAALRRATGWDAEGLAVPADHGPAEKPTAPGAGSLITEPNFHDPRRAHLRDTVAADDFYEALIAAQRDLSPEQSARLHARLILLLSNHIGDLAVLQQALAAARGAAGSTAKDTAPADKETP